jgi:murein DD-endopeptidase MepM/ murein hydrolase activator NlpD
MAPVITPIKSFTNINTSMRSLRSGLGGIKTKTVKLNNILLKKTKVKRESIARNYILSQRRQESERRKNREDIIEASSIGGVFKRQAKAIASSTKGFLGRIMDFLGTLLVGWLMYNLPSIITMAQELIARIQRLYTIVTGFFNNTVKIFRGFGNVLGAIGKNILTFDFTDSNKRVENAMKDLNTNFDDMQSQFDEGFRLLTTSLGEGVASGVDAKPTGTKYENESMQPGTSGSGSGEEETKGGRVSPQAVYSYLKSKGMSDNQALGITANIKGESKFQIGVQEEGGPGVGLFQYSDDDRKPRFLKAVPNYKTNWKGQIDYAINEDRAPEYLKKQFSSPEEAAYWWMDKWERPAAGNYTKRNKEHNDFIKSFKPGASKPAQTQSAPPTPSPAQTSTTPTSRTAVVDQFKGKPGGAAGIITSERGMREGRMHHGIDIAPAGRGYFVALKLSGTVDYIGFDSGGYGNFVDIKSENTIYRFAHLAKVFVKRGQPYNGQTIGEIGTTGGSTGIHLHFEVRPGGKNSIDPRPYLGLLSIGKGTQAITGAPLPQAQVASLGTQQRQQMSQQLSQQRNGPTIVVIEEDPPAQQQVSAGGGGGGMIPIIINPLNSFITKKLLLDLAYT